MWYILSGEKYPSTYSHAIARVTPRVEIHLDGNGDAVVDVIYPEQLESIVNGSLQSTSQRSRVLIFRGIG